MSLNEKHELCFSFHDTFDHENLTCNGEPIVIPKWVERWKIRSGKDDFVTVAMVGKTKSILGALCKNIEDPKNIFYECPEAYYLNVHIRSDNG